VPLVFLATLAAPADAQRSRWQRSLHWLGEGTAVCAVGGLIAVGLMRPQWEPALWAPVAAVPPVLATVALRRSEPAARWASSLKGRVRKPLVWATAAVAWAAALVLPPLPFV
jgi:hypothetical protein